LLPVSAPLVRLTGGGGDKPPAVGLVPNPIS
jgi:hypothetical protein